MNQAFAVYSNRASANEQLSLDELKDGNEESGILSKPFSAVENNLKEVISKLSDLTDEFNHLPPSEREQDETFEQLKEYNRLLSQLKQYTKDDDGNSVSAYDDPEDFYNRIGITKEEEVILTTVIAGVLYAIRARYEGYDITQSYLLW